MRKTGIYQKLGDVAYFIPDPLPPLHPPLELTTELIELYGQASFALGQLNEMAQRLPDPERFLKAYVIKEALLSSEIEGIHTTLMDVFTQALDDSQINKNTQLVLNYTKALDVAINMRKQEGMPLVTRVILAAHRVLMSVGEGDRADPGQFRKQSVRVGKLIPPPATEISKLIQSLEQYMNEESSLPPLIRAGLAHVQFETIHPFLDGNGRIGRMLIVLMLMNDGILNNPILYPSYYFKKHHMEYYQRLDCVRTEGDFEGWINYYLKGIRDSAIDAHHRATEIESLEKKIHEILKTDPVFIKMRETTALIVNNLFKQPITSITDISKSIGKAYNTVHHILEALRSTGLIEKDPLIKRNKRYHFKAYLEILEKDL